MSNKIYLIHGFNVKDGGKGTTDSIRPYLEERGFDVTEIDYGFFHRLRVRLCNKGIARAISSLVEPGSTCIAHSNGAAITYLSAKFGAPFDTVILVNPALDKNKTIPNVRKVVTFYSPTDDATKLASYIPKSIWGAQGRLGYTGTDSKHSNINEDVLLGEETKHSGIWKTDENRVIFANLVKDIINKQ